MHPLITLGFLVGFAIELVLIGSAYQTLIREENWLGLIFTLGLTLFMFYLIRIFLRQFLSGKKKNASVL